MASTRLLWKLLSRSNKVLLCQQNRINSRWKLSTIAPSTSLVLEEKLRKNLHLSLDNYPLDVHSWLLLRPEQNSASFFYFISVQLSALSPENKLFKSLTSSFIMIYGKSRDIMRLGSFILVYLVSAWGIISLGLYDAVLFSITELIFCYPRPWVRLA